MNRGRIYSEERGQIIQCDVSRDQYRPIAIVIPTRKPTRVTDLRGTRNEETNATLILHPITSSLQPSRRTSSLRRQKSVYHSRNRGENRFTLSSSLVSLVDGLDNTNSDRLPHVPNGKATKGRIFVITLNAHRL